MVVFRNLKQTDEAKVYRDRVFEFENTMKKMISWDAWIGFFFGYVTNFFKK